MLAGMLSVRTEYDPLEQVVLGDASVMFLPARGRVVSSARLPLWTRGLELLLDLAVRGRRVPQWIRRRYAAELSEFAQRLARRGIRVHRPAPTSPLPDEPPGLTQVFARDPVVVIDKRIIVVRHREPTLRKETRGYEPLIARLERGGTEVTVMERQAPPGAYLEGGDVLLDWPRVFVGVGKKASNEAGVAWLRALLGPAVEVIPVALRDSQAFHLDTCLTLVGPQRGIVYRPALAAPLPSPLDSYELIEVSARTYREVGVNVFSLAPHLLCLQRRHQAVLGPRLARWEIETIPVPFTWHALAGGALRCATHPLRRRSN